MSALTTHHSPSAHLHLQENNILTVSAIDCVGSNGEPHAVSALFSYYIIAHVLGFVKCFLKFFSFFPHLLFFRTFYRKFC